MSEQKKLDISKINFSRLTLPEWYSHAVKASIGPLGVELYRGKHYRFAYLRFGGSAWEYVGSFRWNELEVAKSYTDRVDAFIAEESARLAAEDDAANWVAVPWQDAAWLRENGCDVIVWRGPGNEHLKRAITSDDSGLATPSSGPFLEYHADRRTFLADYDPEKPRWVEIDWRDVNRLEDAGCAIAYHDDDIHDWSRLARGIGGRGSNSGRYAIDIHTLPPGVPLHVDPPKPTPRPCTLEFALKHPKESECRFRHEGLDWDPWCSMIVYTGSKRLTYEFRTTSAETLPEEAKKPSVFDAQWRCVSSQTYCTWRPHPESPEFRLTPPAKRFSAEIKLETGLLTSEQVDELIDACAGGTRLRLQVAK